MPRLVQQVLEQLGMAVDERTETTLRSTLASVTTLALGVAEHLGQLGTGPIRVRAARQLLWPVSQLMRQRRLAYFSEMRIGVRKFSRFSLGPLFYDHSKSAPQRGIFLTVY